MSFVASVVRSLIALLFCCWVASAQAGNFTRPYTHFADNENLNSLLSDFARSEQYTPKVSEKIKGVLSGRFVDMDPLLFMQGLQAAFGVRYYSQDDLLYFFHESEMDRRLYVPAQIPSEEIFSRLLAANLVADELPVAIQNDSLVFTGPADYIQQLIDYAIQLDMAPAQEIVMRVFKLKHAKAEDMTIATSESTVTVPGMATILRNLSHAQDSLKSSSPQQTTRQPQSSKVEGLRGQGLASENKNQANTPNKGGSSNIIADARLNAVIIQDSLERMPFYENIIRELDLPVRLVELHAAIVDVDIDSSENLGLNWLARSENGHFSNQISLGKHTDGHSTDDGGIFSTIFQNSHNAFMLQINALEKNHKATTLGRPSILTMDNLEATLEDTTVHYVPIKGYQDTDMFKVESGTSLRVTPHIIDDGVHDPLIQLFISLRSNQDNNNADPRVDKDGNLQLLPIKQTKINTQAVVRQGQSLLLGGYYVQYEQSSDNGIPVLKDTPGVGKLFGSDGEATFTRERLLMITPRILSLDEINYPDRVNEMNFSEAATQANYEHIKVDPPKEKNSGCSSTRNSSPEATEATEEAEQISTATTSSSAPQTQEATFTSPVVILPSGTPQAQSSVALPSASSVTVHRSGAVVHTEEDAGTIMLLPETQGVHHE